VANLSWAAEQAAPRGVTLVIEPINHRDMPGFFLNTMAQGAAVVEALGRDKLGLQFDVYHCQVTEGDITKRMAALMPVIAHMQIADVPARNEPGTGEIGWRFVFAEMDRLGYRGWVGCEYRPAGNTVAGLDWRNTYGV
jgi:hydroxypyruvate isomerase